MSLWFSETIGRKDYVMSESRSDWGVCGFQECDQIATPSAGFVCAACMTNTSATVMSDLLLCLMYSVGMHA